MLRDFTWTEKYEEAMSDEHPPTCLTCLRTLRAYVSTCLRVLIFHVPTCLPTCLRTYIYFSCLYALNYFVPACAHTSCAYVPTTTQELGTDIYLASVKSDDINNILTYQVL